MAGPTKAEWRTRARAARAALSFDDPTEVAALADFLGSVERGAPRVLVYRAIAGREVDLAPLLAEQHLGPFALTRTPEPSQRHPDDLTIHPLGSDEERHRYGFTQPIATAPIVDDVEIGVVLVPGLAFDRRGGRLGNGRGYYDRLLARLGPDVVRVGITGGYVVAELPVDEHDVTMTHLSGPFGVLPVPLDDPIE